MATSMTCSSMRRFFLTTVAVCERRACVILCRVAEGEAEAHLVATQHFSYLTTASRVAVPDRRIDQQTSYFGGTFLRPVQYRFSIAKQSNTRTPHTQHGRAEARGHTVPQNYRICGAPHSFCMRHCKQLIHTSQRLAAERCHSEIELGCQFVCRTSLPIHRRPRYWAPSSSARRR